MTSTEDEAIRRAPRAALIATLRTGAPREVRDALERDQPFEALRLAIDAHDLDAASDVVRVAWMDVFRADTRHEIPALVERISSEHLGGHPLLAMLVAISINADEHRRIKAAQYFALASLGARTRARSASRAERALTLAGESAGLRVLGRPARAARSARAALRLLDGLGDERATQIGSLPRVYAHLGISLYFGGHIDEAVATFTAGYAEHGMSHRDSFSNLSMLAGIRAMHGDLTGASEFVVLARGEPWTDEQRAKYPGTFYRLAEALLAVERFDAETAQAHLDAMDHGRRSIEFWIAIAQVEARVALMAGDAANGLARLEAFAQLRGAEGRSAKARHQLASSRALLHLALGNLHAASTILKHDAPDTDQTRVDRARLDLVTGRADQAARELRGLVGRARTPRVAAEAAAIEAAAALRAGAEARADAAVGRLAGVLRETGQRMPLLLVPTADVEAVRARGIRLGEGDVFGELPAASVLAEHASRPQLTPRERAVLEQLMRTSSIARIAAELFVSTSTVKTQIQSIYRKLGVRDRDEAVAVALSGQLLDPLEPAASPRPASSSEGSKR